MGGGSSKTAGQPEPEAEVVNSSGLHLIEIHMPTAGFNVVVLMVILLAVFAGWAVYKRRRAAQRRRRADKGTVKGRQPEVPMSQVAHWPSAFSPFAAPDPYAAAHLAAGQARYAPTPLPLWQRPVQWQAPPAARAERRLVEMPGRLAEVEEVDQEPVPQVLPREAGHQHRAGVPVPEGV